ncbi:VOC family protein [Neobacillus sp. NPDC093127]|uniref:VOC family protein n=1 Tax=Neobacillus sp. NPDC093127 TaxID=3364296 RepID=UPI00381BAFBF
MILEQLILETNQIAELKHFYKYVLDLQVPEESWNSFIIKVGFTQLMFTETKHNNEPFYHFAINIPSNKLEKAKAWITERGVELNIEDDKDEVFFQSWNANSIYFEDPAGNIVELIARHNLPNAREGKFTSDDMLNVSEIGIAREQVLPLVRVLNEKGIPSWREEDEDFTPVGNEEGLIIVVKRGRPWYFSSKNAEIYPVTLFIKEVGELHL